MRITAGIGRALAAVIASGVVAGCAATGTSIPVTLPNNGIDRIPVEVLQPEGTGPFAAIVILHDCSGLGPRSGGAPRRWAREMVQAGYVVVLPDSFRTRGFPDGVCTASGPARNAVGAAQRMRDAYGALAYARSLPVVGGRPAGVMGGSHGGTSTLAAMLAPERAGDPLAGERRNGFAAGLAFYPGCPPKFLERAQAGGQPFYRPIGPVRILAAGRDDWTPAAPCVDLAARSQAAGQPVSIKVYPEAHHAFDSNAPVRYIATRVNGNSPTGFGATTGGNAAAWKDSIDEVRAFFAQHLPPGK